MKRKDFFNIAGILFGLAAIVHLVAFFQSWVVAIGPYELPLWVNLVGGVVAGVMAFNGWQMGRK